MDSQHQDNMAQRVIEKLFHIYRAEQHNYTPDRHRENRNAADNAEDALLCKLSVENAEELRRVITLRAEVNDLDAADIFAHSFVYGAELILNILRPAKPG